MTPPRPVKTAPVRGPSSRAAYLQDYRQTLQSLSLRHATREGMPWTAADDHVVTGPGTLFARATRLGRSYFACRARLRRLREATT